MSAWESGGRGEGGRFGPPPPMNRLIQGAESGTLSLPKSNSRNGQKILANCTDVDQAPLGDAGRRFGLSISRSPRRCPCSGCPPLSWRGSLRNTALPSRRTLAFAAGSSRERSGSLPQIAWASECRGREAWRGVRTANGGSRSTSLRVVGGRAATACRSPVRGSCCASPGPRHTSAAGSSIATSAGFGAGSPCGLWTSPDARRE